MRWAFWGGVALIAYTYAGYPVWLWFRSQWRPWPVRRSAVDPLVSVVMVVRNEEKVLAQKLENLLGLDYPAERLQIVVVSDGSTDGSEQILHEYACHARVQVLLSQLSKGKASGLNDAVDLAAGEIVVFTDARQRIEAGALRELLSDFADPDVGCVSGELMLGDPAAGERGQGMGLYWRIEKKVRELESAAGSVVGATGALYGIRRELWQPIPPETLLDDVLIPMQVVRSGKRVIFEPEARAWDTPHQGRSREFSRKVRTLSGNYQLLQLAPWLMSEQNPIRFEFVSHKLMRLIVPLALVVCLIASAFAGEPFYRMVLVAQLAFYTLSLMGMAGLKLGPLARAADAAFTFVVLNTAALVAFGNFVAGRKIVWTR